MPIVEWRDSTSQRCDGSPSMAAAARSNADFARSYISMSRCHAILRVCTHKMSWRMTPMAFVTRRGVLATSLLVGLAVEAVPMCAMAQTSALVMHSQPGDWVGQGMDQTFTTADGVFTPSINRRNGV